MGSRFKLYLLILLLGFPAWAQSSRSHSRGFAEDVLGPPRDAGGLRPEAPSDFPKGAQYSAVAMEPVAPGKPTDEGGDFREGNSCVILGYTDQKGKASDHNMAMTNANKYWDGVRARLRAAKKPFPRILRVDSLELLFKALTYCPPNADINIVGHGWSKDGGGFCVGKEDKDCLAAWDKDNIAKFVEAAATKSPRSIWLNSCEVAGETKDSKLGNDEAIDKNLANQIANGVYEASIRQKIAKGSETQTKVEVPKPIRVHAFTTNVYTGALKGTTSEQKDTKRVTFEADPSVQKDATRKVADHNASLVSKSVFADWKPPTASGIMRPSIPEWPPRGTPASPEQPRWWEPTPDKPGLWLPIARPDPPNDEFQEWMKKWKKDPYVSGSISDPTLWGQVSPK